MVPKKMMNKNKRVIRISTNYVHGTELYSGPRESVNRASILTLASSADRIFSRHGFIPTTRQLLDSFRSVWERGVDVQRRSGFCGRTLVSPSIERIFLVIPVK